MFFFCLKKTKGFIVVMIVKIYSHRTPFQSMPNFSEKLGVFANRKRTGFYIYTY